MTREQNYFQYRIEYKQGLNLQLVSYKQISRKREWHRSESSQVGWGKTLDILVCVQFPSSTWFSSYDPNPTVHGSCSVMVVLIYGYLSVLDVMTRICSFSDKLSWLNKDTLKQSVYSAKSFETVN